MKVLAVSILLALSIFSFSIKADTLVGHKVTELNWVYLGTDTTGTRLSIAPQTLEQDGSYSMILEMVQLKTHETGFVILRLDCFSMQYEIANVIVDNNQRVVGMASDNPITGTLDAKKPAYKIYYNRLCSPI